MYKQEFIFDTDSLIKLTKSGIIKEVIKIFKCTLTEEVYDEAVTKGKYALHKDAFEIEELVNKKLIEIKNKGKDEKLEIANLGKGELSSFILHKSSRAILVTDDNTFISYLKRGDIEFIVPADFLVLLRKLNKIDAPEALNYLNNLKPHIKPEVYLKIKKQLEDQNDNNTASQTI